MNQFFVELFKMTIAILEPLDTLNDKHQLDKVPIAEVISDLTNCPCSTQRSFGARDLTQLNSIDPVDDGEAPTCVIPMELLVNAKNLEKQSGTNNFQ